MNTLTMCLRTCFSVAFLIVLVACGGSEEPVDSPTEISTPTVAPDSTESSPTETLMVADEPVPTDTPPPTEPPSEPESAGPTPTSIVVDDFVDVGGRRLHYLCKGEGSPTILLEPAPDGLIDQWYYVQRELAKETSVCAYERAGVGESDPAPPGRRTSQDQVDDLHMLLQGLPAEGPYVIVGTDWAYYIAPLYRDHYPEQVVGIVLVDPIPPVYPELLLTRLPEPPAADEANWIHDFHEALLSHWMGCEERQARRDEQSRIEDMDICASYEIIGQISHLGSTPLVVLGHDAEAATKSCTNKWQFHDREADFVEEWCRLRPDAMAEAQQMAAELSSNGRWHFIPNATLNTLLGAAHFQEVVDAILDLVEQLQ